MKKLTYDRLLYWFMIGVRIFVPTMVFLGAFVTMLFETFLDIIDIDYAARAGFSMRSYERIDKLLDFWWYAWLMGYIFITHPEYGLIMGMLLFWRLVGTIMFEITNARWLMVIFPNVFEGVGMFILLMDVFPWIFGNNMNDTLFYGVLIAITIVKLIHEFLIHAVKLNIPKHLFMQGRKWVI